MTLLPVFRVCLENLGYTTLLVGRECQLEVRGHRYVQWSSLKGSTTPQPVRTGSHWVARGHCYLYWETSLRGSMALLPVFRRHWMARRRSYLYKYRGCHWKTRCLRYLHVEDTVDGLDDAIALDKLPLAQVEIHSACNTDHVLHTYIGRTIILKEKVPTWCFHGMTRKKRFRTFIFAVQYIFSVHCVIFYIPLISSFVEL
jgi:hypothetical protein